MSFSGGMNPGDSDVTDVADAKQAQREREVATHARVAEDARQSRHVGPVGRLRRYVARLRRR